MANSLRYVQYDEVTGEILYVVERSDPNWVGDTARPAGQKILNINNTIVSTDTHYMIIVDPGDDLLTPKPYLGMGADITIEGDGSTQTIANSLPTDTKVWRNFEYLGEFTGDLTWDPTSPGDNGIYRYDLEPVFPNAMETFYVTVIDP